MVSHLSHRVLVLMELKTCSVGRRTETKENRFMMGHKMKVLFLLTEFFLSASVGPVAQLVEHQTEDLGVGGSNPPRSANTKD